MNSNKTDFQWKGAAVGFMAASALFLACDLLAADAPKPVAVKQAFGERLPTVRGTTLAGVHVPYAPGAKSSPHFHAGSVYAYVLTGQIRWEISAGGPARVYSAGGGFFDPPGGEHRV